MTFLPFYSRAISGPRPMDLYIKAYPFRLIMTLMFSGVVWWTSMQSGGAKTEFSTLYYVIIVIAFLLHQVRKERGSKFSKFPK